MFVFIFTITMIDMLEEGLEKPTELELTSPHFEDGEPLPEWTGYVNADENPELDISGVPDATESLLLVVIHPEAAEVVEHPWIHWLAWNIDPNTETIPRGWEPEDATEGYNDFLQRGWGGPSPPPKQNEMYRFRLYALDSELPVPSEARYARLASTIGLEAEILGATEIVGTYHADNGTVFATEGPAGLRPAADD